MKKVVIYGINQQAQVLAALIQQEKQASVTAFIVDADYRKSENLLGLSVCNAEEMEYCFPPSEYMICLSFGYKNMVYNRKEKFEVCKAKGYELFSFISKNANIYTEKIGEGSIIYPGSTIMPFVEIGTGCFIESGCVIAHHCRIGAFNFIAPGVHFCGAVKTGENCFFGGASEIINNAEIGDKVFVAAGAKAVGKVPSSTAIISAKSAILEDSSFNTMDKMFRKEP